MNEQETVDRLALLAVPRLTSLLRLRNVRHLYDSTPGKLNSIFVEDGRQITLGKLKQASQPYRDIQRFLVPEKVMQFVIGPGLLPVVMAISKDMIGKSVLVTRRLAAREDDQGVVSHLDGFGFRVRMYFDEIAGDSIVEFASLYGLA